MLSPVTHPAEALPRLAGHTRGFPARRASRVRLCGVRPGQAGPSWLRAGPGRCPRPPHATLPPSAGRAGHHPAQGQAAAQRGSRGLVPPATGEGPAHRPRSVPAGGGGEEEEKGGGRQEEARAGGEAPWGRGFPGRRSPLGPGRLPSAPVHQRCPRGSDSPLAREAPRGPRCDGPQRTPAGAESPPSPPWASAPCRLPPWLSPRVLGR